ncbi:MAG TPA: DinB family protein, partial [Sphingomicrobium sp.]|nr:DinB family protein [Sphingomicrobium sp.]
MATRRHSDELDTTLRDRLTATRKLTLALAAPLSDADATIQPFPDASPAKWHLAHTTWFFETFVLRDHVPGYTAFDPAFAYLFNSYYEGEGERHPRLRRGMLSRPSLDRVRDWRVSVDEALERALPSLPPQALDLVELGINHEQQHQELFLTDILATFAESPLDPAYGDIPKSAPAQIEPMRFVPGK